MRMLDKARNFQNRRRFKSAQAKAERDGGTVCGTMMPDGTPVYFVMPEGSTDSEIQAKAFEIREGRALHRLEKQLLDIAHREDLPTS